MIESQDKEDYFFREFSFLWLFSNTLLLGIASGVLGSFALLRKQSLIGDAVAHAALPGICFAFMLTGEKNFFALLIGAAATGLLAAYTIQFIRNTTRIKEDTAICLLLSVFVAMLIAPGATAYLLTDDMKRMLLLSGSIGVFDAIFGYYGAKFFDVSISGSLAVAAGIIFLITWLFSPRYGLFTKRFNLYKKEKQTA
ncbi:metal ABC transporter permease [Rossellomorea sp. BNER]|uniref:metal ABC transporter permease n=1 Tax=Rossellomorea sp. BNER TaxID=2962031 RepID=UPI003AF27CD2